jgi:hypothetical protein
MRLGIEAYSIADFQKQAIPADNLNRLQWCLQICTVPLDVCIELPDNGALSLMSSSQDSCLLLISSCLGSCPLSMQLGKARHEVQEAFLQGEPACTSHISWVRVCMQCIAAFNCSTV